MDIDFKEHPVHWSHFEVEPDGSPWYFDIRNYLETRTYPENVTLNQKNLIHRDLGLLRFVDAIEAARFLEQIHVGVCGMHMNGLTLERKILWASYFLMTLEHNCCKFVQKYYQYQVHGDLIRVSPQELNAMSSPWPFVAWGMNVIGPIESAASNGHRFILVVIKYFTKWVEVI